MKPAAPPIARAPLVPGPDGGLPREPTRVHGQSAAPLRHAGSVIVLVLVDHAPQAMLWGWSRLVLRRWPLRHVPGLRFSKILGSGHQGGFGLRPSGTRQGLLLGFGDESAARRFIDVSPVMAGYRTHARECCVALLRVASAKGSWSGAAFEPTGPLVADGPIAALTRASIRPRHLASFWRHSPPSERSLAEAPGCLLAVGLGEAPLLRQCTFSVWHDMAAMDAYARQGAHQQAIRASMAGGFFSESMFLRLQLLQLRGRWLGQDHDR